MILQEGAEAAIGGGVESITMMQRDSSPNPWVHEKYPGIYMAMGDTAEVVAKRYEVSRAKRRMNTPLASQQRTADAQQRGFFAGEMAPMQRDARDPGQEDRREDRRGRRCASIATSATGRTRRWTAC